jgi:hypothetical protein
MKRTLVLALLGLGLCGCRDHDGAAAREAERIWSERCVRCHGVHGRGDGPDAHTLKVRPRDFGNAAWQEKEEDEELEEVILLGGKAMGYSIDMPPNPDLNAKPDVVRALIRKIRDLGKRSRG